MNHIIKNLEDLDQENFVELLHAASTLLSKSKKAWFI